jgi:tRNA (guanine37-N1)-methyltransferase
MKFKVVTLFPEFIDQLRNYSVIGRAIRTGKIEIETINLRDFGLGSYKQVDDKPYGGGVGMLLRVDVLHQAIQKATAPWQAKSKNHRIILISPDGKTFDQVKAEKLANLNEIILICGHYEGFDRRVEKFVDEKISVGNYIVSGGELPAMIIIDAISRLIPGVLGKDESNQDESFSQKDGKRYFEYPQYTRPEEFMGKKVPDVLISGNHKKIDDWRKHNRKSIDS